jgi:hypothetical protein
MKMENLIPCVTASPLSLEERALARVSKDEAIVLENAPDQIIDDLRFGSAVNPLVTSFVYTLPTISLRVSRACR